MDGEGNTTTYSYNELNQLVAIQDAEGRIVHYAYDPAGRPVALTDPLGNVTTFEYDAAGQLTRSIDPDGNERTIIYDAVGNRTAMTDRDGRLVEWTYDAGDRVTSETWRDLDDQVVRVLNYVYDSVGRLVSAYDSESRHDFTYDDVDQVILDDMSLTPGAPPVSLGYSYDVRGAVSRVDVNVGNQLAVATSYVHDQLGRVRTLTQSGDGLADKRVDLTYTSLGTPQSIERFASLDRSAPVGSSSFTYDGAGRLTALSHAIGGVAPLRYELTLDRADRVMRVASPDDTSTYRYDLAGQLVQVDATSLPDENFAYDAGGNRVGSGVQIGPGNLLLADATYEYRYDAEGNRVERTTKSTGAKTIYRWDHRNRLVEAEVRDAAGHAIADERYVYDVFDQAIARLVDVDGAGPLGFVRENLVYDRDELLLSLDGAGQATHVYLNGPAVDEVFADDDAQGSAKWLLTDHQGTVRDLIDSQGHVVNHVRYDAFGGILSQTNAAEGTRFGYAGRIWDAIAQAYDLRARLYDPTTGRFLSQDPAGFAGEDFNLSRFVFNSPTNGRDVTGRSFSDAMYSAADTIAPFVAGFGDAVSFGLTEKSRANFARNHRQDAQDYTGSNAYLAGEGVGTVASFALGYGAEAKAARHLSRGGLEALALARAYTVAGSAVGGLQAANGLVNIARGCSGPGDLIGLLGFLPMLGAAARHKQPTPVKKVAGSPSEAVRDFAIQRAESPAFARKLAVQNVLARLNGNRFVTPQEVAEALRTRTTHLAVENYKSARLDPAGHSFELRLQEGTSHWHRETADHELMHIAQFLRDPALFQTHDHISFPGRQFYELTPSLLGSPSQHGTVIMALPAFFEIGRLQTEYNFSQYYEAIPATVGQGVNLLRSKDKCGC